VKLRMRTAASLIVVVGLTGCGTGDSGRSATTSGGPQPSGSPVLSTNASAPAADIPQDLLKFSRCISARGVNVPEQLAKHPSLDAASSDSYTAAYSVCQPLLPKIWPAAEIDADQLDVLRTLADCVRRHQVPLPDPGPDGVFPASPAVDTGSAAFAAAYNACAPPTPKSPHT
jgi:hypothetical protein